MDSNTALLSSPQRLYARLWRWHFFAALLVIPFVLWQAITGTIYLWHEELADIAYPQQRLVTPQTNRVSYDAQLATAIQHNAGKKIALMQVTDDPQRSTMVSFTAANGLIEPAFVDPYSGAYLGSIESTHWVTGLTRGLHGGWPIKPYGSYLLELGASWAIVMMVTGLYLWWPRNARGFAGVLYPRLRAGSRTFWRDLHSIVGVYFSLIVLAFLFTALPWTTFWGNQVLKPIQRMTGQVAPGGAEASTVGKAASEHHHEAGSAVDAASMNALSLDAVIATARAQGVTGTIELTSLTGNAPVSARNVLNRASHEVLVKVGPSGNLLFKATWADYPLVPKLVSTGVDLHEGHFFGRANQIFNTIVALALIWLSVTGFIGWYQRRPQGSAFAPPKRELRYPKAVLATAGGLCILLPMLGMSVLAIAAVDRVSGLWRRS